MELNIHTQMLGAVFAIAVVMGAVTNKTNFCAMGAVSDWVNIGDTGRMRAWVFAMAVALAGVLALVYPGITLLALALIAGINLLILGVMSLVDAFSSDGDTTTRVLAAVLGLLEQVPVEAAIVVPLALLRELRPHEQQLLPRRSKHVGKQ